MISPMRNVYLDNNATTPVDPQVTKRLIPFLSEEFGNAASIHGFGQRARAAVEEARQHVAGLLGTRAKNIVFTSGGTEADNTAVLGVARRLRERGNHIITSTIEHPAVLRSCEHLEHLGFRVSYVKVDHHGRIDLDELRRAIDEETILISLMHANNETGTRQPIEEVSRLARERGITLHTDAVQSVAKIAVNVEELGVDLLSLSAHKFHGPKGVGALFVRPDTPLEPLFLGGSHERGRRAGTENVAGIVGLGAACELAGQALSELDGRVRDLRDRFEKTVLEQVEGTVVNGHVGARMPHVSNLSFRGVEGEALLIALDFQGIAVSTGAACSSGALEPSHVLTAMQLDRERIQGAIRFSLSRMTREEEIDYVLEVLPQVVARMRETARFSRS